VTFLSSILARKREEVAARRAATPERELQARARDVSAPRRFARALSPAGGPMRVIAEIKRASPSAGVLRAEVDAVELARRYEAGGAAAISVLTDGPGFGGSLEDLVAVREAVAVPVLRKDFLVDPYQVLEARAAGADAVLLIVAALAPAQLAKLLDLVDTLGMDALVEVHTAPELETALSVGARLVGINNRDLASFRVDLAVSEALISALPREVLAVAESGVRELDDARRLRRAGAANLLVGEALVRAASPEALLAEWGALP
jgi:indole-3-glycerol phosphate synthase